MIPTMLDDYQDDSIDDDPLPPDQNESQDQGHEEANTSDPAKAEALALSDDEKAALRTLFQRFIHDDEQIRRAQLLKWKQMELYRQGVQDLFFDAVSEDWISISQRDREEGKSDLEYKPIINIVRGHHDSLVAALSAGVPYTRFFPEDASNPDDISTAKGFTHLGDLIQEQNDSNILLAQAASNLCLFGLTFAYTYHDQAIEYGVEKKPILGAREQPFQDSYCPDCNNVREPNNMPCPECGSSLQPDTEEYNETVPFIEQYESVPKSKEVIEIYSPIDVKVAPYIKHLEQSPYLDLEQDFSVGTLRHTFPEYRDKIQPGSDISMDYETRARASLQWTSTSNYSQMTCVCHRLWLRFSALELIDNDDIRTSLQQKFKKGVYFVQVGEEIVDFYNESMDDCWTATFSPLDPKIHAEAILSPLPAIQDMVNDCTGISLETLRYCIPETYADPTVVNFKEYENTKAEIGAMRPARAKPGLNLSASFYTSEKASMSKEADLFYMRLLEMGQFVTADYPSIFGGPMQGGSKTLGEYQQSQHQAMQRLMLAWYQIVTLWKKTIKKAVVCMANYLENDTHFVQKQGHSFINVFIRKQELSGHAGNVNVEGSDQFPTTWSQKKQELISYVQMGHPAIDAAVFHPENLTTVALALGWTELYIPGEDERNRILQDIKQLVTEQPMSPPVPPSPMGNSEMAPDPSMQDSSGPIPSMMPPPAPPQASIPPDQMIDPSIATQVIKAWAMSEEGQDCKTTNPAGYANVQAYFQAYQALVPPPPMPGEGEGPAPSKGPSPNKKMPSGPETPAPGGKL